MFSFEENCCGIIPIIWRSLWWTSYASSQKMCERWFQRFKIGGWLQTRKTAQKVRRWNCKHCWMKMIHKNNSQFSVSQQAVSNRLREMGKIQKVGRWVPHFDWFWIERETDGEAQKHMWNFARIIQKKVILASYRYWGWKVDFFWESQAQKIMSKPRCTTSTARPNCLGRKTMLCVGGTRRVWSIMSYWSLAKRLIPNAINNNWSIWTVRCLKNDQNTKRGNKRSFFSMTMLHHIRQNQFGWKHSAGKFYPMRLTHQTWLLPITTCLHRWVTHLLSSTLVRTKMWKNGSMNGSQQKGKIFTGVVSTNCPKDEKNM